MNYYCVTTTVGLAKMVAAEAAGQSVTITEVAVGDGNAGSGPAHITPLASMASLVNEVDRIAPNKIYRSLRDPTVFIAEGLLPAVNGPYEINEISGYDIDGDMIYIGSFPRTTKEIPANGVTGGFGFRGQFKYSNAAAVTITSDPSVITATYESVNEKVLEQSTKMMLSNWGFRKYRIPSINDIKHNGLIYVLVGNNGLLYTSTDGEHWELQNSGVEGDLVAVAWNNGASLWAVCQQGGNIITSPDGVNWTQGSISNAAGIASSDDRFIVFFESGSDTSVSVNGVTWTTKATSASGGGMSSISCIGSDGLDLFLIFGDAASGGAQSIQVINTVGFGGGNWSSVQTGIYGDYSSVVFGGSSWVLAGGGSRILRSTANITTWEQETILPTASLNSVIHDGSQFLLAGKNGTLKSSVTGEIWKTKSIGYNHNIVTLNFSNGLYLAGAEDGNLFSSVSSGTWELLRCGAFSDINDICYGVKAWVAVGDAGLIVTSINGIDWYESPKIVEDDLNSVYEFGGEFVAVGYGGAMVYSSDGISWVVVDFVGTFNLNEIFCYDGVWLVGANSRIFRANSNVMVGASWSSIDDSFLQSSYSVTGVYHDNNKWMISVGGNEIYTSIDLISWVEVEVDPSSTLQVKGIIYKNGYWLALASDTASFPNVRYIVRSLDGTLWSIVYTDANTENSRFTAIDLCGDHWVAVDDSGSMYLSADANSWAKRNYGDGSAHYAIHFNGSKTVIGGPNSGLKISASIGLDG